MVDELYYFCYNRLIKLKEIHMNYYENKHGKDLKSFIIEMDPEAWLHFCLINAMKYQIRAGKKEGESESKDFDKRDNYLESYIELTGEDAVEVYKNLASAVNEFNDYDN